MSKRTSRRKVSDLRRDAAARPNDAALKLALARALIESGERDEGGRLVLEVAQGYFLAGRLHQARAVVVSLLDESPTQLGASELLAFIDESLAALPPPSGSAARQMPQEPLREPTPAESPLPEVFDELPTRLSDQGIDQSSGVLSASALQAGLALAAPPPRLPPPSFDEATRPRAPNPVREAVAESQITSIKEIEPSDADIVSDEEEPLFMEDADFAEAITGSGPSSTRR